MRFIVLGFSTRSFIVKWVFMCRCVPFFSLSHPFAVSVLPFASGVVYNFSMCYFSAQQFRVSGFYTKLFVCYAVVYACLVSLKTKYVVPKKRHQMKQRITHDHSLREMIKSIKISLDSSFVSLARWLMLKCNVCCYKCRCQLCLFVELSGELFFFLLLL